MPVARFEMPDGRIARFEVPEGTTPEQAQALISKSLSQPTQNNDESIAHARSGVVDDVKNIVGGLTRSGMGVVSNLMRPIEAVIPGGNDFDSGHKERMGRVADRFKSQGYDQNALAFQGAKLAGDVAITAPVGGALAAGAKLVPGVAKTAIPAALRSGGFSLGKPAATTAAGRAGDLALRTAGGATTGAASAGLIDMDTAGTGAVIGGAMPGAVRVAGKVGGAVKKGAGALTRNTLGLVTGTGGEAVGAAYQAGKSGNKAFLDNMRGKVSADDLVTQAKGALQNMRAERGAAYRSGMADIRADRSVMDFTPISKAMDDVSAMGSFKGQQINKNASGTVQELADTVNNWRNLDPAEYHTPEGLDALKQAIGDIRDSTQFGTPARRAADSVYNAVKGEISRQAPTYSRVMKDYSEASEALREVEKSLSLGEKASKDTALRKLLSIMRNNVNTNFGNRGDMAQRLVDSGARDLLPAIAGQSMTSATPRGLQGLAATGSAVAGMSNPAFWATLPLQSPRLMGEAAYGLGRAASAPATALNTVGQSGLLGPQFLEQSQAVLRTLPLLTLSSQTAQR